MHQSRQAIQQCAVTKTPKKKRRYLKNRGRGKAPGGIQSFCSMALAANAARIVKQSSQIINRFLFCCIPSVWHPYTEYIGLVSDLYLRESLIVWLANKFFTPNVSAPKLLKQPQFERPRITTIKPSTLMCGLSRPRRGCQLMVDVMQSMVVVQRPLILWSRNPRVRFGHV